MIVHCYVSSAESERLVLGIRFLDKKGAQRWGRLDMNPTTSWSMSYFSESDISEIKIGYIPQLFCFVSYGNNQNRSLDFFNRIVKSEQCCPNIVVIFCAPYNLSFGVYPIRTNPFPISHHFHSYPIRFVTYPSEVVGLITHFQSNPYIPAVKMVKDPRLPSYPFC